MFVCLFVCFRLTTSCGQGIFHHTMCGISPEMIRYMDLYINLYVWVKTVLIRRCSVSVQFSLFFLPSLQYQLNYEGGCLFIPILLTWSGCSHWQCRQDHVGILSWCAGIPCCGKSRRITSKQVSCINDMLIPCMTSIILYSCILYCSVYISIVFYINSIYTSKNCTPGPGCSKAD